MIYIDVATLNLWRNYGKKADSLVLDESGDKFSASLTVNHNMLKIQLEACHGSPLDLRRNSGDPQHIVGAVILGTAIFTGKTLQE